MRIPFPLIEISFRCYLFEDRMRPADYSAVPFVYVTQITRDVTVHTWPQGRRQTDDVRAGWRVVQVHVTQHVISQRQEVFHFLKHRAEPHTRKETWDTRQKVPYWLLYYIRWAKKTSSLLLPFITTCIYRRAKQIIWGKRTFIHLYFDVLSIKFWKQINTQQSK